MKSIINKIKYIMITVLKRIFPDSNISNLNEFKRLKNESAFDDPIHVETDNLEIAFSVTDAFMGDALINTQGDVYAVAFCGFRRLDS